MYIATFDNSQSIFLMENQLKTLQSVTRNGRINSRATMLDILIFMLINKI